MRSEWLRAISRRVTSWSGARIKAGVVLAAWLLFVPSVCRATNPGFLPGDCCFITHLGEELLDEIDESESPVFLYSMPDWYEGAFCGYSGYWRLQYVSMPKRLKDALRGAYGQVRELQPKRLVVNKNRETGEERLVETNPLRMLIVNADYDVQALGVVSRYNENWPKESLAYSFAGPIPAGRYVPIVHHPDVVMREWAMSERVAPLDIALPAELAKTVGPEFLEPVRSRSPLKFVILTEPFESYRQPANGVELSIVDESGAVHLTYSRRKRAWRTDEEVQKDEQEAFEESEEENELDEAVDPSSGQAPSGW